MPANATLTNASVSMSTYHTDMPDISTLIDTSTCNHYMMYTIVELGDFHCTCNSLAFVLQAVSVCVTKF